VTLEEEASTTLDELRRAHLEPGEWAAVRAATEQLESALVRDGDAAVREAMVRLSRAAFAGKVRRRMPSGGVAAPGVAPTKQTSALPAVGFVCGGILLGTGWSLGGGLVLAGCALFAIFIFGVAFAGSRVAHRAPVTVPIDTAIAVPDDVRVAIDRAAANLRK
jgi:hypothetical protein